MNATAPRIISDVQAEPPFRGFRLRREVWTIADQPIDLSWPADMDALLDAPETQRRNAAEDYMPYWAQPWPSALLLARQILLGEAGTGRRAIELGCGIGIGSLAAARMGWSIVASDYDDDAIAFAQLNANRNGVALAGCLAVDYRCPLDEPQYELVIGSDLLYERKKGEPVARWLASAIRTGGYALITDPNRSAADAFPELCDALGLRAEVSAAEMSSPAGLLVRGRIWRITHAD